MAIFPKIECDDVVQVRDKFRISAMKSYLSKGEEAITKVEIQPEAGGDFIEVQGSPVAYKNFYLDWEYDSAGEKVVSLRITTDGSPVTLTKTLTCLSEADDKLLSGDQDLANLETDVLKFMPESRSSFKYAHREAQKEILEWLYKTGFRDSEGNKLTISAITDKEEFRFWSKYTTFRLICKDLSKSPEDFWDARSKDYENDEKEWRHRASLLMDLDGDGETQAGESLNLVSRTFIRR